MSPHLDVDIPRISRSKLVMDIEQRKDEGKLMCVLKKIKRKKDQKSVMSLSI